MKAFVIDVALCNGCHNCQIVCKDEHCGVDWMPYAKEQPDTGQFWMRVNEKVRGSVPVVKVAYTPVMCQHCENASCMEVGGDAVYRREDGLIVIDPEKAAGNKELAESCPYGAIYWNESLSLAQKCTGCAHLLDDGWTEPRCVDACATGAMRFGDVEDFADEIAVGEYLPVVDGMVDAADLLPHVYYLNLPKRFVAGAIVDFANDEVVVGSVVKLVNSNGDAVGEVETDEFGDFIFNQVDPDVYTICVSSDGFARTFVADATEKDVNLGDCGIA